jgi:hypothetical protein
MGKKRQAVLQIGEKPRPVEQQLHRPWHRMRGVADVAVDVQQIEVLSVVAPADVRDRQQQEHPAARGKRGLTLWWASLFL